MHAGGAVLLVKMVMLLIGDWRAGVMLVKLSVGKWYQEVVVVVVVVGGGGQRRKWNLKGFDLGVGWKIDHHEEDER